ncbi:hypothetical protein G210_3432 [Candida maltosa Xu316]|uniref:Uncharacterized protein n=1 Tax=Candida maltosa (strain Xu316) TaxID=1245528 RepID=M3J342_CANMX|nr:hypothetical protein G210_3432 [Candida maltosa Xu316]
MDSHKQEQVDPDSIIDTLFSEDIPTPPTSTNDTSTYPELILQDSTHGNKYYQCFQSYNRQFINDNGGNRGDIVRWNGSTMEVLTNMILDNWLNRNSDLGEVPKVKKQISRANALFTWASTDQYIEERKKELLRLRRVDSAKIKESANSNNVVEEPRVLSDEDIRKQALRKSFACLFKETKPVNLEKIIAVEFKKNLSIEPELRKDETVESTHLPKSKGGLDTPSIKTPIDTPPIKASTETLSFFEKLPKNNTTNESFQPSEVPKVPLQESESIFSSYQLDQLMSSSRNSPIPKIEPEPQQPEKVEEDEDDDDEFDDFIASVPSINTVKTDSVSSQANLLDL